MKNITEEFKKIFKKKKIVEGEKINPHKHWKTLLGVFFIVVLVLVFFSLFLLYKIKNDQIFQAAPTIQDSNISIKESLLKNVNESFQNRAQKEKDLKANPPTYRDPSL